jgi:hypothetical protein
MKNILLLLTLFTIISCSNETQNFTLKGNIKGLKKGTVYLEREQDSTYIIIDSLMINGNSEFELHSELKEPEVLYLRLNKNDDDEGIIPFFADKGITEIQSTLKNFNFNAKIKGSKQQEVLEEYLLMMSKFNNKNLELIKENFDFVKDKDTVNGFNFDEQYNNLVRRKYLYTINFAVNNKDSEVAPYLAITEISNVNRKFLDTIYNALDDHIKVTLYGKKLKEFIKNQN